MVVHRLPRLRPLSTPRLRGLSAAATLLLIAFFAATAAVASADKRPDPRLFPVPPSLEPNVAFWTRVYSGHDDDTVLLHDDRHLQVVYAAISMADFKDLSDGRKRLKRRERIRERKAHYAAMLDDLAAGRDGGPDPARAADMARIAALFNDVPGGRSKYRAAKARLRTQTCLRNQFAGGIERSGRYMTHIEATFREAGLPLALTRLPFVESLFREQAKSSRAAGGIWQFMPSTGRLYMTLNAVHDERYDPLTATRAAAKLLTANHANLKTWPLAITAYNHGRAGMARAVRKLGTRDLGTIAARYRSRTFGFASRNFYSEFIAAAAVYADRERLFPGVEPLPPLTYDVFAPPRYVALPALAAAADTELDALRALNPALQRAIWRGDLYVPKDFTLRVPDGTGDRFSRAFAGLSGDVVADGQRVTRYRVRRGDTLGRIAARHGTTVGALQRANNLRSANRIRVGQVIEIPKARGGSRRASSSAAARATPARATASAGGGAAYVVRPGDTLSAIGARHGVSVDVLRRVNQLRSADQLRVGQRLRIPAAGTVTHVVRRGETLTRIAARYGTTARAIRSANGLRGDLIRPAQVLVIPAG
ncbi:MAG: LysM peptidoglycan-binding domain-containing protein [Acidobacteriota bacterium]